MKKQTTAEAAEEFRSASRELFFTICKELRIDKLAGWLAKRLERFQSLK